jgi:hypothetical protein
MHPVVLVQFEFQGHQIIGRRLASFECTNNTSTGIYGPGYDERRKQRIKEAYGIDVPEPIYKSS